MLAVGALVVIVVLGLADLGIFLLARTKAQTAADAAALAAAADLLPGPKSRPETEARRFASLNGARLIACDCQPGGTDATVEVSLSVRYVILRAAGRREVLGRARAELDLTGGARKLR